MIISLPTGLPYHESPTTVSSTIILSLFFLYQMKRRKEYMATQQGNKRGT